MEPISNNPPLASTQGAFSISGRAFTSFGEEIDQLVAMTKDENLPLSNLGSQVDLKA